MKPKNIILVPHTHWDREWYLPFQEYRARLVLMMDKLLKILRTDPSYKNFCLDGQTIPIDDYLEVRPGKEEEIKKHVKEGRLSIGPMYVLPDEFLISGESMVRNLLIGHQIAEKFGKVMKAGYIPDPFGHIAQLPQIIYGCDIPSVLFWRGFGDEFEDNQLNVEFTWNAPGNAASILAIHLVLSYSSLADLNVKANPQGIYKKALSKIKRVVSKFEKYTASPVVVLNSGSDHHEAKPEVPAIVKQWNEEFPDQLLEQNDFEYYVSKVLEANPDLKEFQGELRGGRYAHLLSGVLSARMWIKQRNTSIEYLYEKYAEPLSTITWALDRNENYEYPQGYLLTGYKWLIKNHPHDSICGCSIDQVHNEMATRFDWAEQIAIELYKNAFLYLVDLIDVDTTDEDKFTLIVYNPLPWNRSDIVSFNGAIVGNKGDKFDDMKITDVKGKEYAYQHHFIEEEPRYTQEINISHKFTFLAEIPACGYKVFYIVPGEASEVSIAKSDSFRTEQNIIENEFYNISVNKQGSITITDKKSGKVYENILQFEDIGDWGDEYDYSGPQKKQTDLKYLTEDASLLGISTILDGPTQKTLQIRYNLKLPLALSEDRYNRMTFLVDNKIHVYISLYKDINRIDFRIELENNSKDHRFRVLFPSLIRAEKVHADGHFYVIPRIVNIPSGERWAQKPLGMNHQKDFVAVSNQDTCFAILNKGLPEYEAIRNDDGTVTLAITILRCVEWLSRGDFATRNSNAGPDLKTPGAQCIGEHSFELAMIIENGKIDWKDAEIHVKGKEFNNPLMSIIPFMARTPLRMQDKLVLTPLGILSYFLTSHQREKQAFLPAELSFLRIDNKNVSLSILKKAEKGENIIIRVYNISSVSEQANITFNNFTNIEQSELVNLMEHKPQNAIKAGIIETSSNNIKISLEPNVIATIRVRFSKK